MKIKLAKSEIIHFVGIGGIGMSGLSLIMKGKGFKVQGSDISSNKNIERLKKERIKISIGHKKQNINKATIIVVSSAIKKNNPELIVIATQIAFLREKAFFISSSCPAKSIPCLNFPAFPITPFNLIWATVFFFLKKRTLLFLIELLIENIDYL